MYILLVVITILAIFGGVFLLFLGDTGKIVGVCLLIIGLGCGITAINTSQGQIYYKQFFASGYSGAWLVIDNSGGKTLRHYIIKESHVKSTDGSDGWQFDDEHGALVYVGGDAFVRQIVRPMDEFLKVYKTEYNIPTEQKALH